MEALAGDYRGVLKRLDKLDRVFPRAITEPMIDLPAVTEAMLLDETLMQDWCEHLLTALTSLGESVQNITLTKDEEHQVYCPVVQILINGMTEEILLSQNLFMSADYRSVVAMGAQLHELMESGARVERGERYLSVGSFGQAVAWLLAEARRGVDIQRYKGLGEMNPDQLWQTTMDPSMRRMLQVTVDDAIAADQMFTTLMGDQVEPRREFIETNALSVVNLDV